MLQNGHICGLIFGFDWWRQGHHRPSTAVIDWLLPIMREVHNTILTYSEIFLCHDRNQENFIMPEHLIIKSVELLYFIFCRKMLLDLEANTVNVSLKMLIGKTCAMAKSFTLQKGRRNATIGGYLLIYVYESLNLRFTAKLIKFRSPRICHKWYINIVSNKKCSFFSDLHVIFEIIKSHEIWLTKIFDY